MIYLNIFWIWSSYFCDLFLFALVFLVKEGTTFLRLKSTCNYIN